MENNNNSQEKKIVLIADRDENYVHTILESLSHNPSFTVGGTADNGLDTLSMIEKLSPDILLLNLILPCLDGLGVLSKLSSLNIKKRPIVIIMTGIQNAYIDSQASQLGADYILLKPFDVEYLIHCMYLLIQQTSVNRPVKKQIEVDLETIVTSILNELAVPRNIQGFRYLRYAILLAIENPEILQEITKQLYPVVAEEFKTTSSRAERSIRHAIEKSFKHADPNVFKSYFIITNMKPTNSEYIATLADIIILRQKHK